MALGYWIAIAILLIAILAIVIGIFFALNKASEPLNRLKHFQEDVQHTSEFYEKEIQYLSDTLDSQIEEAQALADQSERELENFNHLQTEAQKLGAQLSYIGSMRDQVIQTALEEGKVYVQHELPRQFNKWKLVSKKTLDKQKERYSH
ncbi:MAG: hypothetical protein Q4F26_04905 [Atopococcus tabaci]|uniref:Uncharacterized protein n=1 Tax=Atopococcus tabaci TaxID=269774 RepID=A0AA43ZT58_9LACT|nr:hypothetical protein [Atopococcus tabaci]